MSPRKNSAANGKPNRNGGSAAPSAPIRSRCIALRSVWAHDASSVTGTQTAPYATGAILLHVRPQLEPGGTAG
jgi:hypothetical protein